jgi:hypothetical protein
MVAVGLGGGVERGAGTEEEAKGGGEGEDRRRRMDARLPFRGDTLCRRVVGSTGAADCLFWYKDEVT